MSGLSNICEVKHIQGIEGEIKKIYFDSDFKNLYIISSRDCKDTFFILDKEHNIILSENFEIVWHVVINKFKDIYVFSSNPFSLETKIWLFDKSKKFRIISKFNRTPYCRHYSYLYWKTETAPFIDNDNNIFFNTDSGVSIIKSGQNIPFGIENLSNENYVQYSVDESGDVYLKTVGDHGTLDAFVVTKEAKNRPVPSAKSINKPKERHCIDTPSFSFNERQCSSDIYYGRFTNFLIYQRSCSNLSIFTKLTKPENITLLSEYNASYKVLFETDDTVFVLSEKGSFSNIYYITKDDKVGSIDEIFENAKITPKNVISDKTGNIIFPYKNSIILFNEISTETTKIEVPIDEEISHVFPDGNDSYRILADNFYMFQNETKILTKLPLPEGKKLWMKENRSTNEIFIASKNGLIVVKIFSEK